MRFKSYIFLVALFASFLNFKAQNLLFRQITSDNGLSTNLINCITKDSKGFMWFGTQDGLNRYDGYHIKTYKHEPSKKNSLSYSEVNCILEIEGNVMLVGTPSGLNFLNLVNDSVTRLNFKEKDNNSNTNHINVIKKISNNLIAVGTKGGLVICDVFSKEYTIYKFNATESNGIKDVLFEENKLIIASTRNSLWEFELKSKTFQKIKFSEDLVKLDDSEVLNEINKMLVYAGKLFLGTNGGGLIKVDLETYEIEKQKKFKEVKNGKTNVRNYVNDIILKDNKAYCATSNGFIIYNLLSEDTAVYLKNKDNKNAINDDNLRAVYLDENVNIWLGTYFGGINVSFKSAQKFMNHFKYRLDDFKNIFLTYEDTKGNLWLSGEQVLRMLPANEQQFKLYSNVIGKIDALSIYQENNNVYWFGTYGEGIKRFDISTNKTTPFLSRDGITVLSINRLDDYLLFATYGDGLFKLNLKDNSIMHYDASNGLENLNLTNVFIDKNKTIWLLTDGGGALNIENFTKSNNEIKILKHCINNVTENSMPADVVYAINQDNNGHYWFGTSNGLSRFDGKNYKNFYESDGLANAFIYSILKDSTGRFWMSTNKGVTAFNPTESNKPFFKNYNLKDGLTNTEHNLGAASASSHGNMLFGGPNGYNIFRPSQIKDNLKVPLVQVISFKRAGKDIALDSNLIYKKHLQLSWRENYFQLEVAALDFIDPDKNLYRYKLENYDQDWSEPSNIRYISYTELPGGTYTLKIKASNSDGVWNEQPHELTITIIPPFWRTTWFYIVLVVFGTASVVLFTQWRTKQIKKENKILESKVADRTKELAEKNRDITSSIQYAKRIQEAILPSKDYIFTNLSKAFILYKPKDIVSGDFYWFGEREGWKIFAVVDCTGHGVPGAFMSMIGHNLMHQIILEKGIYQPGKILEALHKGVQDSLRQGNNEINTNDGMDVSIIAINDKTKTYLWAGANRPLILLDNESQIHKIDGNKYPIGGAQFDTKREFTTHTLDVKHNVMAYLFSDGYADQFGGESGKKFMVRKFYSLLTEIHKKDIHIQQETLNNEFEEWRKNHEQIDDVLVVGIAL